MLQIDYSLLLSDFLETLQIFWRISGEKIRSIEEQYDVSSGSPVFTAAGKYINRGWTEWTQGFQYGSAILQFDATGDEFFLNLGRQGTIEHMAPHISHFGVHDHGFNTISTYGALSRLMLEGRLADNEHEKNLYELALKVSGAVQASRWTEIKTGGFIHSFNGPHSLFVDAIRSCRVLMISHLLGHALLTENDRRISLLERAVQHLLSTANFSVYYGEGRDLYDVPGRTAHESIFNTKDGNYRCPNSQQGYSAFTTWMRGLAWAILGFAEELELFQQLDERELSPLGGRAQIEEKLLRAAVATCDFYIKNTPTDGIPYWDSGAPNLPLLGEYLDRPAEPFNDHEPVDSSAAAIGAQGLLRLGRYFKSKGNEPQGNRYWQAGLTVLRSLLQAPYLCSDPNHQGLILHSVYHRPNGWDYVPAGSRIPNGEAGMWGDYHAREAAFYLQRFLNGEPYYSFWGGII
jgi:unsaturated chondroitin disaccharide hydrolase